MHKADETMKKYKIGACGNFDLDQGFLNGQVIRSCSIMNEIENKLGQDSVCRISYTQWKKKPIQTLCSFIKLLWNSENVILFPDLRAIYALVPLGVLLKGMTNTKVYYNVIGGWLPDFLIEHKFICRCVKKLDGLFVQTRILAEQLKQVGIEQTTVFPNFKRIKVFSENELIDSYPEPLKLVFMSRVTDRKGICELVGIVNKLNQDHPRFCLDIYGSVEASFEAQFRELKKEFSPLIQYKGQVDPLETSETMHNYFLHVFPTTYRTEGYPGSVLDALSAGLPTLAARWLSFEDVLTEKVTGISFTLGDWGELEEKLMAIYDHPEIINGMRKNCLKEARKFAPETVIDIMLEKINVTK